MSPQQQRTLVSAGDALCMLHRSTRPTPSSQPRYATPQTLGRLLCLVAWVQRLAKPWDSPEAELTFKPRISARSQQLMAEARGNEGGGGFLDRLKSDLRRREAKQKVQRQHCVLWYMVGTRNVSWRG